jgi:DNA-binding response OmpR family regulator
MGDDSEEPKFIGTVRGAGYRFLEQVDGIGT